MYVLKQIHLVDVLQHVAGVGVGHLASVGAVALIAVVLSRVVRGGDHNTRLSAVIAHGVAEHGGRLQLGEQMDGDTGGGQHAGGLAGEHVRLDTGIERHRHGGLLIAGVQVVGETLSGLTHGVDVHTVGAGADNTAQTAGTESQLTIKTVADLRLVARHGSQLGHHVGVLGGALTPQLIHCHNIHNNSLQFDF